MRAGKYTTASEYIRELIRDAQTREDERHEALELVEPLLLEALRSGKAIEATPEYWENKRHELLSRTRLKKQLKAPATTGPGV